MRKKAKKQAKEKGKKAKEKNMEEKDMEEKDMEKATWTLKLRRLRRCNASLLLPTENECIYFIGVSSMFSMAATSSHTRGSDSRRQQFLLSSGCRPALLCDLDKIHLYCYYYCVESWIHNT